MEQEQDLTPIEIDQKSVRFLRGLPGPQGWHDWAPQVENIRGLAFVGRSNVGKSTLINTLFGKGVARVSNTPGRTREINVFEFRLKGREGFEDFPFYFFDLPGYGHASVSKEMSNTWNLLMDTFFSEINREVSLINIQDARHPHQSNDQDFYKYITKFKVPLLMVFNKMDKLKTQSERAALKKMTPDLLIQYKKAKQIFFLSAQTGQDIAPFKQCLIDFLILQWERDRVKNSSDL